MSDLLQDHLGRATGSGAHFKKVLSEISSKVVP